MSHIPATAMKHAHTQAPADAGGATAKARKAPAASEHGHPPLWTMVAAGVTGAVGTALFFTLRSSTPAVPPKGRRKPARTKKKAD